MGRLEMAPTVPLLCPVSVLLSGIRRLVKAIQLNIDFIKGTLENLGRQGQ
jgi:hypothetical protein